MSTTTGRDYHDNSARSMLSVSTAMFAASMLAIVGICQVLQGIAAVADDKIYVAGLDYAYEFDVTTWGWIHIVVGAVALVVGGAIMADQNWGRMAGIAIALLGAVANFLFLPYYPFWALVLIAFNVFVVWALCYQITSAPRAR